MRCIHLLDTHSVAGTERHVLSLVAGLRRQGVDAWIGCCGGSPLHSSAVAAEISTIDLGAGFGPRMLAKLWRDLRHLKFDVLHAHNGRTHLMGAILHELTGIDLFATQHFLSPQFTTYRGIKRKLAAFAHQWVNGRVKKFIAVSEAARTAMIQRERLAPERVITIPNGIEPIVFPSADCVSRLRAELEIPEAAPLVVTVARLVREKGLKDLLDAIPAVLRSSIGAKAYFAIVGEGVLLPELVDQACGLGIDSRVLFAGFRSDAPDLIAASDVFVLPSPAEPFGLVLLEAMALARPVIAVSVGGPLEIVDNGITGRLVPPSTPAALGSAIIATLADTGRAAMGQAGFRKFQERFTASQMVSSTVALYGGSALQSPVAPAEDVAVA